jgi:hypothetical protein
MPPEPTSPSSGWSRVGKRHVRCRDVEPACASWPDINPVSLMTTAMRGLMNGGITGAQLGLALLAPALLTLLLAPVTLWLYRRK